MNDLTLPDFLIVGTMKSGTSTLADYLQHHEAIHFPDRELHYFDDEDTFKRGNRWYAEQLTAGVDPGRKPGALMFGEKTPTYCFQPNCAPRIKEAIPDAKLIWIFRDPVQRAFSNYLHARKKGSEPLSFRRAIEREDERVKENIFYGYAQRSKYAPQVERFLGLFPASNMLFLLFEDLVRAPQTELNKATGFLGVEQLGAVPTSHTNETVMPFFPASLYHARKLGGYDGLAYRATRKINKKLATRWPRERPALPEDVAEHLAAVFAPHNRRLAELTGLDLQAWRTPAGG